MTQEDGFAEVPGARALIAWFGFLPRFHDANLLDIELSSKGTGTLRLHAFRITHNVDDRGYFILDRHVLVTLTLETISDMSLSDFHLPAIIGNLFVKKSGDSFRVEWNSSYGVAGSIVAQKMRFDFEGWCPELAT